MSWKVDQDQESGWVEIAVGDDGPGIEDLHRQKVFEPFHTGKAKGAGLGLAVVKQLAGLNEVGLRIETASLGGAAVILALPLAARRP